MNERLGNPCKLALNLCASQGSQYTCKVHEDGQGSSPFCVDVCRGFCSGGMCHVTHKSNDGHDEKLSAGLFQMWSAAVKRKVEVKLTRELPTHWFHTRSDCWG